MLSAYVWRRFLNEAPWDERLLRATAAVRRGGRSTFELGHGAWSLSVTGDGATLENWVYGDDGVRIGLDELEALLEARLEPCQACGTQARFPRLRDWAEYRLRDGSTVFMCPDCMAAAEPAAA